MTKMGKVEDENGADNNKNGKYGEPKKYDPSFHGPIADRSCTDIICCIIFVAFILGLCVVGYFGWSNGDPNKLIYPTDYKGQICGYDKAVKDKPYLLFFDLLACADSSALLEFQCPTRQICVEKCPSTNFAGYYDIAKSLSPISSVDFLDIDFSSYNYCDYDYTNETVQTLVQSGEKTLQSIFDEEICPIYYIDSTQVVGRCIPSVLVETLKDAAIFISSANASETLKDAGGNDISKDAMDIALKALTYFLEIQQLIEILLQDLTNSWQFLLGGLGLAMVLSFLVIVIMRWLAGIIVWLLIAAVFVLTGYGVYYCVSEYLFLSSDSVANADSTSFEFTTNLASYLALKDTWLAFSIILAVIFTILLILLLFLCTRIRIAISLIKEGSRAVSSMMFTLLWPIFPFIFEVIVVVVFVTIAVYLASAGAATYEIVSAESECATTNGTSCDPTTFTSNSTCGYENSTALCIFVAYGTEDYVLYFQIYNLFAFFWLANFVVALNQMVLAGAFASYYWAFTKPNDIPGLPVTKSLWRAIRYHLGSLAFGSLLIAIVQMIRVGLEYLDHKLGKSENAVAKFVVKCLKCCFWCLEKFLKFLNKNAYIMIAIYGKNFCSSAKEAFFLIIRNIVRVVVLDKIADFLLFVCKLAILAAVGIAAFFYFSGSPSLNWLYDYVNPPDLNYYWIPIIVIVVGTYLIVTLFFGVYSMAVDTLFLCFLEDCERHDGSAEKPYYMNKELMGIIGKKNKVEKED